MSAKILGENPRDLRHPEGIAPPPYYGVNSPQVRVRLSSARGTVPVVSYMCTHLLSEPASGVRSRGRRIHEISCER
jgi:hypothetical protein